LTKAMKIDLKHDGLDLCSVSSSLWLAVAARKTARIGKSMRIGLTHGAGHLLRFYERGNEFISGSKRLLGELPDETDSNCRRYSVASSVF